MYKILPFTLESPFTNSFLQIICPPPGPSSSEDLLNLGSPSLAPHSSTLAMSPLPTVILPLWPPHSKISRCCRISLCLFKVPSPDDLFRTKQQVLFPSRQLACLPTPLLFLSLNLLCRRIFGEDPNGTRLHTIIARQPVRS